ncbi:uncharacterized protein E5676_scaffold250G00130 [Cucumis melo var. makuwa]|uniref:CACTA en-spm transposon protein n=1 Tax=Cucumis melo var. makuwa TaxID=1194695 RepID=A0A5D3DK18_CUCMM|nr:uncharacterized protein E5676_scaffold250G00130 [Cucumis melo var. makuwa]
MQKVRPLGTTSSRSLSQEEKRHIHSYILNNADEIAEYHKQATLSTYSKDINGHFLIGSEIRCIVGEVQFHMIDRDFRRTTQNSGVMVVGTMSNFLAGFDESDDLFNFNVEEFNIVPDTSSVGDTSYAFQPIAHTPRRREHSRNLNNTISVNTTFLVHFLKWDDMTPGYTKLVKGGLQIKESSARLELSLQQLPPSTISEEQLSMNKATRVKQAYNYSSGVKSFLQ